MAAAWWAESGENRRRLVRHGLRALAKDGHSGALAVLGSAEDSPVEVAQLTVDPLEVAIGDRIRLTARLSSPSDEGAGALVDFVVHFVEANGSTSPKVFEEAERTVQPGTDDEVSKSVSVAQHSTRTHYPGVHRVEVQLNGRMRGGARFQLHSQ